ncbi:oocyte-secreted protein 1 [Tupaia chinensis]|uniref:oocyte-secreted protein 1 n=1 Tax=Tupaia chinensis TaxID=246437 RepID=UPI0003C8FDD7|nr:oocyte-secreted protein 1 [Tupaia chinensis]XP_006147470.1 oocyte-secreted protein 1 [Tupaia chinensis]XP_006147472.1 oocyte-secreted protein 1 [Tupaia chinensis]XP_027627234.1 oocyte-secreted protein 1 [Tupaia chinensis]XP_027627235.1 oocyte-secreted protein 1 [Tupaia chinensis]
MNADEVFLGDNCPVTHVLPDVFYEFFYHPHDCGIVTKTLQEILLLKTKIKYISRNSTIQSEMPLSCIVRDRHPLLNQVERRDDESSDTTEWEIKVNIHITDEAMGISSTIWPCENMNVTFAYLSNDVPLLQEKKPFALY